MRRWIRRVWRFPFAL